MSRRFVLRAVLLLAAVPWASALPAASQGVAVSVDLRDTRQTLLGFGATIKPLVYGDVDYLSPSERTAALTAAIADVGITTGNLELSVENDANDNDDPFVASRTGFDFGSYGPKIAATVEPGAALGLTDWYPGSRIDLRYNHEWLQAVRDASRDTYLDEVAEHVLQQLLWWRDVYGQTPTILQLLNEPITGGRELALGRMPLAQQYQEVVDILKRAGARARAAGFSEVLFVVPNEERVSSTIDLLEAIYADPEARQYVGAIGYHPYPYGGAYASPARILAESGAGAPVPSQVSDRRALRAMADRFSEALGRTVPVWMTEVSEGPRNNDFTPGAVEEVRARAIHIHDEIRHAGASAYYAMHLIWDRRSHVEHFAGDCTYKDEESVIVLIDNFDCDGDGETGAITINGIGYAIGHYARWAPPGSRVVETRSSDPRVQVTGFHDVARQRLALVLVNNRPASVAVTVDVEGADEIRGLTGEASYGDARWGPAPAMAAESGGVRLTLPPESVVSVGASLGRVPPVSRGEEGEEASLGWPFPNPAAGSAAVPFRLAGSAPVRLDVVDAFGRVVAVLAEGVRPAGDHVGRVPSGLAAGRYLVRLRTPRGSLTAPLVVVR